MTETKREAHDRLQDRTDELRQDTADLDRNVTPFNKADHDEHAANLRKHKIDLAAHKLRPHDDDSH